MKVACVAAFCRVFFYCSEKGQAIAYPSDGAGRLPGKPERNAVPRKGDTMGMARAGEAACTHGQTSYFFCTYRSLKGDCGIFLFDTFLSVSQSDYKKTHGFYFRRTRHSAGALFLCFGKRASAAVQGPCAAPPVLKTV